MSYNTSPENFLSAGPKGVVKVIVEGQAWSDPDSPILIKNSLLVLDSGVLKPASAHITAVTGFEAKFAGVALETTKLGETRLVSVGLVMILEFELYTNAAVVMGAQVGPTLAGLTFVSDTQLVVTATEAIGRVVKSSQANPLGLVNDRATVILFANGFALA